MFKEKLIELRKSHNETQEALAYRLHVSRSLVAKWEQGRAFPTINDLNMICEIYEVEFDELLSKNELKEKYGIILENSKKKFDYCNCINSICNHINSFHISLSI